MTIHSSAETYHYAEPVASRAKRRFKPSSQGHFVGETGFLRGDVKQRVVFESLLEVRVALCLIYTANFLDLEEQIKKIRYRGPAGKVLGHHLDFRMTFVGGRRVGATVKPWARATAPAFIAEMNAVHAVAVPAYVDEIVRVTERHFDAATHANA